MLEPSAEPGTTRRRAPRYSRAISPAGRGPDVFLGLARESAVHHKQKGRITSCCILRNLWRCAGDRRLRAVQLFTSSRWRRSDGGNTVVLTPCSKPSKPHYLYASRQGRSGKRKKNGIELVKTSRQEQEAIALTRPTSPRSREEEQVRPSRAAPRHRKPGKKLLAARAAKRLRRSVPRRRRRSKAELAPAAGAPSSPEAAALVLPCPQSRRCCTLRTAACDCHSRSLRERSARADPPFVRQRCHPLAQPQPDKAHHTASVSRKMSRLQCSRCTASPLDRRRSILTPPVH